MQKQLGFIGPSYTLRSPNVDCQKCINLYPEMDERGTGKNGEVAALVSTPGLRLLSSLGTGPGRGQHYVSKNGRTFAVSGNTLYETTDTANPVALGSGATSSGTVSMADNGLQLIMVDGDAVYLYDFASGLLGTVVMPFAGAPTVVAYMDGYFIVPRPNTNQFFISALFDGSSWDALDFASKEGGPDNLVSVKVNHRELFLQGEHTSEVWVNTGNADFPFERRDGAFIESGTAAAQAIQDLDNSFMWPGKDKNGTKVIYRMDGYTPTRVSTFAVELALASYGDISTATAYTYQDKGHTFYLLNCPNATTTWVFDVSANLWHERQYTASDGSVSRHRAENHIFAGNKHLVQDYQNGNLYELTDDVDTDNGDEIWWERTAPHIAKDGAMEFHKSVQLDMQTGIGDSSGSEMNVMMQYSKDGGHTWGNEHWASAGKVGEYTTRVVWNRLGRSRDRVYKIRGNKRVTLISGLGDISVGRN